MSGPKPFSLGDAPEPAEWPETDENPSVTGLQTHTGTDPNGRAIGPAEDHTKVKVALDEEPPAEGESKPRKRTRKRTA